MKPILKQAIYTVPIFGVFLCTLFYNTFLSFLDSYPDSVFYYKILVIFGFAVAAMRIVFNYQFFLFKNIDFFLFIYGVVVALGQLIDGRLSLNETAANFLFVALFYLACRGVLVSQTIIKITSTFFVVIFVLELMLLLYQVLQAGQLSLASSLYFSGTLKNSGLFAGLMVSLSWFSYYKIKVVKSDLKRQLGFATLALCLIFILVVTRSRSAVYALLFTLLLANFKDAMRIISKQSNTVKAISIIVCIVSLTVLSSILFSLKKDSAIGRNLIWKISVAHLSDKPIAGIGYGNFSNEYNLWQGKYFKNVKSSTDNEKKVAAFSFIAFNEPLEILLETGVVGFTISIFLFAVPFRLFSDIVQVNIHSYTLATISLTVFSFFSYPFHCVPMLMLLAICFSMMAQAMPVIYRYDFRRKKVNFFIITMSFLTIGVLSAYTAIQFDALQRWNAVRDSPFYYSKDVSHHYEQLNDQLYLVPLFQFQYGFYLFNHHQLKKSAFVLEKNKLNMPDIQTLLLLGKVYDELGAFDSARHNFILASEIVPNNLESRYLLVKLYNKNHLHGAAISLAKSTLLIPVKIETPEADEIRSELKQIVAPLH